MIAMHAPRAWPLSMNWTFSAGAGRLADWKSVTQQAGSLRYGRSADFQSVVAQASSVQAAALPWPPSNGDRGSWCQCMGLRAWRLSMNWTFSAGAGRLADWKSATQQAGSLRYGR